MIHVVPECDIIQHEATHFCACGPCVEFHPQETLVIHEAMSGFGDRVQWLMVDGEWLTREEMAA